MTIDVARALDWPVEPVFYGQSKTVHRLGLQLAEVIYFNDRAAHPWQHNRGHGKRQRSVNKAPCVP
ncbi:MULTISPECIES: hypothetical protein [unclassified Sinorhizobium]|uniref:hypothetical protein n=1 Tax=unclassified Sinorhizobium TaxID=2613772 RepID=UPI003525C204